jgi:hypothetical protein
LIGIAFQYKASTGYERQPGLADRRIAPAHYGLGLPERDRRSVELLDHVPAEADLAVLAADEPAFAHLSSTWLASQLSLEQLPPRTLGQHAGRPPAVGVVSHTPRLSLVSYCYPSARPRNTNIDFCKAKLKEASDHNPNAARSMTLYQSSSKSSPRPR